MDRIFGRCTLVLGYLLASASCAPETEKNSSPYLPEAETVVPAEPEVKRVELTWSVNNLVDEFGDVIGKMASSQWEFSIRPMNLPYQNTGGRIVIGCSMERKLWIWFEFTNHTNFTDGEMMDGFNLVRIRYRDGNRNEGTWVATYNLMEYNVMIVDSSTRDALSTILGTPELFVVFRWWGSGNTVFKWDLDGAEEAIEEACSLNMHGG